MLQAEILVKYDQILKKGIIKEKIKIKAQEVVFCESTETPMAGISQRI